MNSLNQRIRNFYNESTPLWLNTWGEQMHHGYYGKDGKTKKGNQEAQVDLIKELISWGQVESATKVLDAGCGVGGSARYLAKRFNAQVLAVTLSEVQAEKARQLSRADGSLPNIHFEVKDVMTISKADGSFNLVWSLECAEHIADKKRLLEIFYELLEPGGKFIMTTWCHRDTPAELSRKENRLLHSIGKLYHLPPMISIAEYDALAKNAGFLNVQTDDWSAAVIPFWKAVMRSAFTLKGLTGLMRSGWATIKGAWALGYMIRGYRSGTIKYGVIQGQKK